MTHEQYFTKRPGIKLKDLDEATQAKVLKSFEKTDDAVLAEEWFSYQFAQSMMGQSSMVEKTSGQDDDYKNKLEEHTLNTPERTPKAKAGPAESFRF